MKWPGGFLSLSVRNKLILGVALVHLVLMTIFVLDIVHRQKVFLLQTATSDALKQAELTAAAASSWVLADDLAGIEEVLQAGQHDIPIRYALIADPQGLVLAHTDHRLAGKYLSDPRSLAVLKATSGSLIWHTDRDTIHAAAAILTDGHPIGYVLLGFDTTPTSTHLGYVYLSGFLYTLIAITVGTLFAWFLARYVLRQLRLLLEGVDRMGANQLDQPIPIIHNDEIGTVAQALNNAMDVLDRSRAEAHRELRERQKAEQEIHYLSQRLIGSSEEERKRIGHDLHDELGQLVTSFQFGLQSVTDYLPAKPEKASELCTELSRLAEEMGDSVHRIASHFWPATLEHLGLRVAAQCYIEEFNHRRPELRIRFSSRDVPDRLNARLELVCYRILQEGLTNIARHARARSVEVNLEVLREQLHLLIKDDGIGFEPNGHTGSGRSQGKGIGLLGMRERAASVDGNLAIISAHGRGCAIEALLPLPRGKSDQGSDRAV